MCGCSIFGVPRSFHWMQCKCQSRRNCVPLRRSTNSDFIYKEGARSIIQTMFLKAASVLGSVSYSSSNRRRVVKYHQMSLLAAPLASLFFFSGFVVSQNPNIHATDCSISWSWVCMLSFLPCILWTVSDLLVLCIVVQLSWPKSVHSRSVLNVNLQRGL